MKKNRCLNFFKGIACFGVVLAHFKFPGDFGNGLMNLARWTVPYFYMISGYYAFHPDKEKFFKKIPLKIKHILKITIISVLVYFIFCFFEHLLIDKDIIEWLKLVFSFQTVFDVFIITNFAPTIKASHLWYLPSLIYCYILIYNIVKYRKENYCYFLIPILTLLRILVPYLPGFNWHYQQNFFLGALAYFLIGYYFAEHQEKLTKLTTKLCNKKLLVIITIGLLLRLLETFTTPTADIFEIGTLTSAISIFIFAQKNPDLYISKFFEIVGTKYSLFIYIMHVLVGMVANTIFEFIKLNNYNWYPYLLAISVPILTLISAIIWELILKQVSKINNNQKEEKLWKN